MKARTALAAIENLGFAIETTAELGMGPFETAGRDAARLGFESILALDLSNATRDDTSSGIDKLNEWFSGYWDELGLLQEEER